MRLNLQAKIDSVTSIRELVLQGQWSTLMPVSVFKQTWTEGGTVARSGCRACS